MQQNVRQTSDPPVTGSTWVSNQDDRPTTPSNLPRIPLSSSLTSAQDYFSTPAQHYTSANTSSPYAPTSTSGAYSVLSTSPYTFQQWPTYSTPNTSHDDGFHNLASLHSPPIESFNQPAFVASGKNKYFDYYSPMNNANSSTESFASHFHSHSQQTSEESAQYAEHPVDPRDSASISFAAPFPPSTSTSKEAQTQPNYLQPQQPNATALSSSQILPAKDYFTQYSFQHAQLHGSWDGTYSTNSSGYLPTYGPTAHLAATVPALRATHQQTSSQLPQQQQNRRVGQTYGQSNEGFQSSFSSSLLSEFSAPRPSTASSDREHNAMYHTREDSSLSSSASESVNSASLTKQAKHDDGRPKRPLNAFMIYSRARRSDLHKEQPALKVKEISSALADEWRNLDKPTKDSYLEMARVVKETFHKTHPNYVFSRRANGTKGKKLPAAKTSLKRVSSNGVHSSSGKKRDSDDSPFSPEGSISSASSTSSFAFPRQQSPLNPSVFRRPSTALSQSSSGQSSRHTPFGGTQSAANSRQSTPALIIPHNKPSERWPSVLADPFTADYSAQVPSTSSSSWYPSANAASFPSSSGFNGLPHPSSFGQPLARLQQSSSSSAAIRSSQSASPVYHTKLPAPQIFGTLSSAPDRSLPNLLQPTRLDASTGGSSTHQNDPSAATYHGSSESSDFLSHYRAHMATSSSPVNDVNSSAMHADLGTGAQAFSTLHGLPSDHQAQWQHRSVLPNRLLPSMHIYPQAYPYHYSSLSSAMTFPALGETSVLPTTPLRLPSLSQLDMSPLHCDDFNPPTTVGGNDGLEAHPTMSGNRSPVMQNQP